MRTVLASSLNLRLSKRGEPHVEGLLVQQRRRTVISVAAAIGLTVVILLLFLAAGPSGVSQTALVVLCVLLTATLLAVIWRYTVFGLYVIFAGAVVLQTYGTQHDYIGQYLPFFEDINTWTHSKTFAFSLAEVLMLCILVIWVAKGIGNRTFHFDRGSLIVPLALYGIMLLYAEFYGLKTGGDTNLSLAQIRAQIYMLVAYMLTCNLVSRRKHVATLAGILLLGAGIRGIEGAYRYLFEVRGPNEPVQELYPHEQAFFFNLCLMATIVLFTYGGPRWLKGVALFFFPIVLYADLANNRRAATVAIAVAILAFLVITLIAHPMRRKVSAIILVTVAIIFPPYYSIFQHKDGVIAQPARAVASNFHPDPRDAASNTDRYAENSDIMFTMRTSPILGFGFGKFMFTPYLGPGMGPGLNSVYLLENVLPHNSILWVWMTMGTVGYVLLWWLIALAIKQAMEGMRRVQEPVIRGLALFIGLTIMQEVIFGFLDLQWTVYRNLIVVGVLLGLLSKLGALEKTRVTGFWVPRLPVVAANSGAREARSPQPDVGRVG